ncbi:class I SAM-dependent methyltransferase [Flavobacterium sp. NST-5]|uniref:Class I SAM-dependent methyltransferase n=1 Tax=Flavobacterium ichthyis TaxID=2698827 RepID=A0ABW9ZDC0_9FLAO|nr:class I SAM-dependent methyltransferase [Flavobacterium ichthyis]NBL65100.1 class I SAM-dependent methyltransferase [Flavobacterium ichthyis]
MKHFSVEIRQFINDNLNEDFNRLALKKNPFPEYDWKEILNQIAAKSKAKTKLPTWFENNAVIFPSKISVEQTSSEKTAAFKASLICGDSLIDLTGGFGVDDFYFAKNFKNVVHCEINPELSAIVKHNFEILKAENIQCETGDSLAILHKLNRKFSWIYIDPSRRNDAKGKVFLLEECLPNVPFLQSEYFRYADNILIKTAPILDISAGINELKNVAKIHVVALENEVKELLWEIQKDYHNSIEIKTVNLQKNKPETFNYLWKLEPKILLSKPLTYLYEPNHAILKSGGFDFLIERFNVKKLHQHSHLFTSETLVEDFPGRKFKVENVFPYNKKMMKENIADKNANVATRNFPESVENLRKKWKIKDGGNSYVFFSTNLKNEKIVLLCQKI